MQPTQPYESEFFASLQAAHAAAETERAESAKLCDRLSAQETATMQEMIERMEAEKAALEAQNAALKVTSEAATAAKDAAEAAAAAAAAGGPSAGALADAMLKKAAAKLAEDCTGPRGITYYTKTASKKKSPKQSVARETPFIDLSKF